MILRVHPAWVISLGMVFYATLLPRFDIGAYNDDASYVLAAQAFFHPDKNIPAHTVAANFPSPGLPLLLAPFATVVAPHWSFLEIGSLLITALAGLLFWRLSRLWLTRPVALLALVVFIFNPTTAHFSGVVMPEPYFLFAALASFLLLRNHLLKPSFWTPWILGLMIGWASLVRPEGIILLPSVLLPLIHAKQWKAVLSVICAVLLLVSGFQSGVWRSTHWVISEYRGDLMSCLLYWAGHYKAFAWHLQSSLAQLFAGNVLGLSFERSGFKSAVEFICVVTGLVLITAGYLRGSRAPVVQRQIMLSIGFFCYSYFLIHALWRFIDGRYFVPLAPFAILFGVYGFEWICKHPRGRAISFGGVALLLLLSYGYQDSYAIYESFGHTPNPNLAPSQTYMWVRAEIPLSSVFLSPVAAGIRLYTQRDSLSLVVAADEDEFTYLLTKKRVDFIFDRPINAISNTDFRDGWAVDPNEEWDRIRRWLNLYPDRFERIYRNPFEMTTVYRFKSNPDYEKAYDAYREGLKDFYLKDWDAGFARLDECLRLVPSFAPALNAYGATYIHLGKDLPKAEQLLLAAVRYRQDYAVALLNLARLYKRTGHIDLSRKYAQSSVDAASANHEMATFAPSIQKSQDAGEIEWDESLLQDY